MKIKKVLLVPNYTIVEGNGTVSQPLLTRARMFVRKLVHASKLVYNQELLYYADLPKVAVSHPVFRTCSARHLITMLMCGSTPSSKLKGFPG